MGRLVELDSRRRVSLGGVGRHSRYLVHEEPDGTLIFEPAVVVTVAEQRFLSNPALVAQVEESRAHPGRLQPRPARTRS